ncbi:Hypothetical protein GbCGDNIH1_2026 [Granulibacter bethesdensis CGDNIH1]|uniref:TIGR02300 family protein n=3 Tax=Granulibacter bethesdensis TaxID=364410 RepID=Q0BQH8_GRABC|nr:Hypothetical protein GbCGDNIH1_2026 [Granulibacter bethesdensis CGDNIH1]APH52791.1 Hypothetical protein GbCGDNIH5_2026 [Granulibacter bethesdensis]APH60362.1 Hypothetical protein GbCGDNIH7_2026 [Granulibacter bethesdensis]APH65479.1 Hypothetical protein GbCGDNIH1I4_2026 [Granulibacter bethesdensis]
MTERFDRRAKRWHGARPVLRVSRIFIPPHDHEAAFPMVKPELGTKRVCVSCGTRFYDLLKSPAICPKCGAEQPLDQPRPRRVPGVLLDDKPKKIGVVDDADTDAVDADDTDEDVLEDTSDLEDGDDDTIEVEVETDGNDDEH